MARFAYVNGQFVPYDTATISINDRGLQFGDAIYEVWALKGGKLLDHAGHLARMHRSLGELQINFQYSDKALGIIIDKLIELNRIKDGLVYMQISRGTAVRDHPFPKDAIANLILTIRSKDYAQLDKRAEAGIKVKTYPDLRWGRVDIKTTNLLPNVLAKQDALKCGFDDAWFYDSNGNITEGSAQNAWILTKNNKLQTRNIGNDILAGITRAKIIEVAKTHNLEIIEAPFTIADAKGAREAFVTSATSFVTAVTSIDDCPIGNGSTGIIASLLRKSYFEQQ